MKITIYKTYLEHFKRKKDSGIEIVLKPFEIHWEKRNRTIGFNVFPRKRMSNAKPKYINFKFGIWLFDNHGYNHWIELTILNWIASLRIDTAYGRKKLKLWAKRIKGVVY